jgi:hypothetical protein
MVSSIAKSRYQLFSGRFKAKSVPAQLCASGGKKKLDPVFIDKKATQLWSFVLEFQFLPK